MKKHGRNDLCPCGSGKKYKQCCLQQGKPALRWGLDEKLATLDISKLRLTTKHSIVIVESEYPIERYTCAMHAFHLVENPIYIEIASFGEGHIFAGHNFINFLLGNRLLAPRDQTSILPDDLILYFDNSVYQHIGRMKTNCRVQSKWGTSHLFEHGVWEVPPNYGDEVRYFVGPDKDASFALFIQYAESQGFPFGKPFHV
jgi:hypothetical protein